MKMTTGQVCDKIESVYGSCVSIDQLVAARKYSFLLYSKYVREEFGKERDRAYVRDEFRALINALRNKMVYQFTGI